MPFLLRRRAAAPLAFLLLLFAVGAYALLSRPAPSAAAPHAASLDLPRTPAEVWPGTGAWAMETLAALTLEEKVSQMFSVYAYGHFASADSPEYERLVDRVERFGAGGVIFFQSDPTEQAKLVNELQARAEVPLLISQDMEWGAGMRVEGATSFPRQMAVGATRAPRFARSVGYVTAREARALGTHHVLAPVADVNNNPDNPIINVRSYGEAPDLVAEMVASSVRGLQEGGVLATAKHFPGHGDTATDSHLDLPLLPFTRQRLESVELVPFRAALQAGVMSVMTGHLAFPQMEPDSTVPATLSPNVVRALLREDLGFEGLVVTDAMNMQGVTKNFSPGEAAVRAIEAGTDVVLMSEDVYAARTAVLRAIEEGRLSEARIDESVARILRAKEWLGLNEDRSVDLDALRHRVATREHLVLSHVIARQSLTLLRNDEGLLPLLPIDPDEPQRRLLSITLSDDTDDETGAYFTRQLRRHAPDSLLQTFALDRTAPDTLYQMARAAADSADVVFVPAFLRVRAWSGEIDLSEEHRALVDALVASGKPVVVLAFGNPYLARGLAEQPAAYIAAYGSTPASQRAAAAALFGKGGFHGRLPVTIPSAYAFGDGLMQQQVAPDAGFPEAVGMRSAQISRIDSLLRGAIEERAFPGAAVSVGRGQTIAKLDGYGYFTYEARRPVRPQSVFDMASLTKVIVTTTAAMQLYEAGRLSLDAPVARYLPDFAQNAKGEVTIRQLLTHSAGLVPFRPFYQDERIAAQQDTAAWRAAVIEKIMAEKLQYEPGTESRYSDLGFITLGLVIEKISGQPLADYAEEHIFEPLGMTRTGFRPIGKTDSTIVPTERDDVFRQRLVQGEVHDEAAFLLGGAAGHAGLFSTAEDLSLFASMLVSGGRIYGRQFLQPETIRLFTAKAEDLGGTRALGWDTKSAEGYSSAGQHFGMQSFGHTGFTGTSLWIDPEADLFVILLTNRVYPTRENRGHIPIRPQVADLAFEAVAGPPEPLLPGVAE